MEAAPAARGTFPLLPGEVGPAEDILDRVSRHPQRDPEQPLGGDGDGKIIKKRLLHK